VSRVSVIIPCYNREDLLAATLDSLQAQTYSDWEGIVVDDQSQDGSLAVAQRYALQNDRFRAVSRQGEKRGANVCRNQGLSAARGDYIVFLDSDDLLSPTCLECRVAAMDRAKDCGFGVFQTELFTHAIGDRGTLWNAYTDSSDLYRFLSLDTVWLTTGPIWRKQALAQLGGFDEDVLSFQDWAVHVRALIARIKYFKEPLRDNFHRHDYGSINTISAVKDIRPDHLQSHEKLFVAIFKSLQTAGLLDLEARRRLAGVFWWLARRRRTIPNVAEADRVWRQAFDLGLISRRESLQGRFMLRLYFVPGGKHLVRMMQWSWPPQYRRIFSKHLFKTPVGAMEPSPSRSPRMEAKQSKILVKSMS
jgi:glycosyltransferase involved in cell wall biosynthesis